MHASEARILANRINSSKSTGPTSVRGREISRKNGLKHGLTGRGVVLAEADAAEVERLHEALLKDLAPKSTMGAILVRQMAVLSARMDRASAQEIAAVACRVRNAAADFDEARVAEAEAWLAALGDDPRGHRRRLRRSPEGVDLMIQAWLDLRADLTRAGKPLWAGTHLVAAANLTGLRDEHARASRLGVLSRAAWGDLEALSEDEGAGLDDHARRAWARARLAERIDQEVAELEEHYETLDFDTYDRDRAEAGSRALFDPSKEATLARRYEEAARRGFFKALREYRQAEAEHEAAGCPPAAEPPPASASPAEASAPLASCCESGPGCDEPPLEMAPEGLRPVPQEVLSQAEVVLSDDGRPIRPARPAPGVA